MITIDPTASVSKLADIETSTRGSKVIVGAGACIDSFVKIKMAGGLADVVIGPRVHINSGTVIYSGNGVTIGAGSLIAANCTLAPVNHAYMRADTSIIEQRFAPSRGGIIIEDDVWIGAGTVLLDGAIVRRGCVIAAQSLVRGETEPYGVYAGNPIRLIKFRT
jgi:virginiamycin A acetyltransferase